MKTQEDLAAWNEKRLIRNRANKKRYKERHREKFREARRRWKKARRKRRRLGITLQGSKPLCGVEIVSKYLRVTTASRLAMRRRRERIRLVCMVDPEYYAMHRAKWRMIRAKAAVASGRAYRPCFNRRIPGYATFGRAVWAESPWLIENLTPSQRAYARELMMERREENAR